MFLFKTLAPVVHYYNRSRIRLDITNMNVYMIHSTCISAYHLFCVQGCHSISALFDMPLPLLSSWNIVDLCKEGFIPVFSGLDFLRQCSTLGKSFFMQEDSSIWTLGTSIRPHVLYCVLNTFCWRQHRLKTKSKLLKLNNSSLSSSLNSFLLLIIKRQENVLSSFRIPRSLSVNSDNNEENHFRETKWISSRYWGLGSHVLTAVQFS